MPKNKRIIPSFSKAPSALQNAFKNVQMRRPNFLWFSMVYALTLLYLEKTLIKSCNFSKKVYLLFLFSVYQKRNMVH